MSDMNRRVVLKSIGTTTLGATIGFQIKSVAAEAPQDPGEPASPVPPFDIAITNNSRDDETLSVQIFKESLSNEPVFERYFYLRGLANDSVSDVSEGQFKGLLKVNPGTAGTFRVKVETTTGQKSSEYFSLNANGFPKGEVLSVYLTEQKDLKTFHLY